jgi:hypothetical protein
VWEVTIAKVDIAALLALVAALMSGVGDVIRQRSAQEITDQKVGHLELLRMSVRDFRWCLAESRPWEVSRCRPWR